MSYSLPPPSPAHPVVYTPGQRELRDCPAPAKLNRFLHITGRRPDGYHSLQTVFQLIDDCDRLHFKVRDDSEIRQLMPLPGVPAELDLTIRAATLLQRHTGCRLGVDITLEKALPAGAGLGGGSSDAATTLLALNRLWQLDLPRAELQQLALQLGADVPFFVFGRNAFASGVGEALEAIELPQRWFLVVTPAVHVPTAEIFAARELTRDSEPIKITDFLGAANPDAFGRNDMQAVVVRKYAEVAQVLDWFSARFARSGSGQMAPARMSGSGASVFAVFSQRAEAGAALAALPAGWRGVLAASLDRHPLFAFAS